MKKQLNKLAKTIALVMLTAVCTTSYAQNNGTSQTDETAIVPKNASSTDESKDNDDTVWANTSEKALFPGGDSILRQYITDNLVFPESVKGTDLNGTVPVFFVIGKDGQIEPESVRIPTDIEGKYKGLAPELDAELIRVMKSLPKFEPAYRHLYKYGEIERVPARTSGNVAFVIRNGQLDQLIIVII